MITKNQPQWIWKNCMIGKDPKIFRRRNGTQGETVGNNLSAAHYLHPFCGTRNMEHGTSMNGFLPEWTNYVKLVRASCTLTNFSSLQQQSTADRSNGTRPLSVCLGSINQECLLIAGKGHSSQLRWELRYCLVLQTAKPVWYPATAIFVTPFMAC